MTPIKNEYTKEKPKNGFFTGFHRTFFKKDTLRRYADSHHEELCCLIGLTIFMIGSAVIIWIAFIVGSMLTSPEAARDAVLPVFIIWICVWLIEMGLLSYCVAVFIVDLLRGDI